MVAGFRYNLTLYYALTFLAASLLWLGGSSMGRGETGALPSLGSLSGFLAPFLVSLGMILASGNGELRRDYADRIFNLTLLRPSTLPTLLLLMPMVVVASVLLSLLAGEPVSQFQLSGSFAASYGAVPAVVIVLVAAASQELGWRGYPFEGLRSRHPFPAAALLFGALWALWHLPLLFLAGAHPYHALRESPWFALNFYVGLVPVGFLISWFSAANGRSVLAATLFHFSVVASQEILAVTQVTRVIETVLLSIVAAAVVARGPLEADSRSDHSGGHH